MEIRVLRYFLAVAREQSISGAAEVLHLSQPTLSRQLMDMEEELKKKLFIRGNRRISLTEEGMFLRKRAQEIVDLVDKTQAEITSSNDIISGDIYIGAGETDAIRLVARVAKKLQEDYPDIRYHIFSGNAEDVTEKLDKGLLDFGILIAPTDTSKYESIKLPATDSWGVLMRKDSPLSRKDQIVPEDLWDKPLLCSKQIFLEGKGLSQWIKKEVDSLHIVSTYNLIFNASIMVEEGFGYALSLDKLVKTPDDGVLCFRPLKNGEDANLDIVWKKYQVFSKAAELFLKRLHETFDKTE
jgi:DNA-binding transcriptional LysR family regulator